MIGTLFALFGSVMLTAAPITAPKYANSDEGESEHTCYVTIVQADHGEITADLEYGEVGDVVTVNADADMFYLVGSVTVNGTSLVESEDTKGEYSFALVEGENVVTASFEVDTELLGSFASIYDEIQNKDWTNVFSVETVLTIVKWVLDGGILIAIARYFIKDKKLAKSVEEKIQTTMEEIVPETTKEAVLSNFKEVLTPMVSELQAENSELMKAMSVFAKCMALAQENTAESRKAIIDELSGLQIGDSTTLADVKSYIEKMVEKQTKVYNDTLDALKKIESTSADAVSKATATVEESKSSETAATGDNGTQI